VHPVELVRAALEQAHRGRSPAAIGRELGVPRETVRGWIRRGDSPSGSTCPRCGAHHDLAELAGSYAYLLGLYLGDGCLSEHMRGVYRLRIVLDTAYPGIIEEAAAAILSIRGRPAHVLQRESACVQVSSYWRAWPCLFPQHGPGAKHRRPIVLQDWQGTLVEQWPGLLLRGLIHSDGCRFLNTGRNWSSPRYSFSNHSDDIRAIFCAACDVLGLRWTEARPHTIYVSRKTDVAVLDELVGPKR
jgi:hypothetical protein